MMSSTFVFIYKEYNMNACEKLRTHWSIRTEKPTVWLLAISCLTLCNISACPTIISFGISTAEWEKCMPMDYLGYIMLCPTRYSWGFYYSGFDRMSKRMLLLRNWDLLANKKALASKQVNECIVGQWEASLVGIFSCNLCYWRQK